jgi:hypothetical protein
VAYVRERDIEAFVWGEMESNIMLTNMFLEFVWIEVG